MQFEFEWSPKKPAQETEPAVPEAGEAAEGPQPEPEAPSPHDTLLTKARTLREELVARSGTEIFLHVTDNRSRMLSLRHARTGRSVKLRLHHMFLDAPEEVRAALATWVRQPKEPNAGAVIDAFVRGHRHRIRQKPPPSLVLCTRGRHFDLEALYSEVNAAHFNNTIDARITWGRMPGKRVRRTIRFGSYSHEQRLIRIHPLLDQDFVPEYIVRYIVFHEMLHAALGIEETPGGRRRLHPPQFKKIEKTYPDYERACAWIETPANLNRLLRHHG
jgi:hypothetical protein